MGNTQSQGQTQHLSSSPIPSSFPPATNSRRFGSPKPKGRAVYGTSAAPASTQSHSPSQQSPPRSPKRNHSPPKSQYSPRRSSSLRGAAGSRPPRSPGGLGRERERVRDRERGEREREREREKEREIERNREQDNSGVHRSLRQKKKSLELPDLASLTPVDPANILSNNISVSPPGSPNFGSSGTEIEGGGYIVRSSIAFPQNLLASHKIKAIPAMVAPSAVTPPAAAALSISGSITSSIPGLGPYAVNPRPIEGDPTYLVKISWHGGGQEVFLMRAGDDDWNGRRKMDEEITTTDRATVATATATGEPEPGSTTPITTFSTIISVARGTHHLRFLVDGQQRVADDLPTAVDDNGSLANYVGVGLGPAEGGLIGGPGAGAEGIVVDGQGSLLRPVQNELAEVETVDVDAVPIIEGEVEVPVEQDHTDGQVGVEVEAEAEEEEVIKRQESFWSDDHDDHSPSRPNSLSGSPLMPLSTLDGIPISNGRSGSGKLTAGNGASTRKAASTTNGDRKNSHTKSSRTPYLPTWTQEIPLELLEAAAEEETYLAYQNEVDNAHAAGRRIHITGFVPLPNVPPAPKLPRYLEKVILNSHPSPRPQIPGSPGGSRGGSPGIPSAQMPQGQGQGQFPFGGSSQQGQGHGQGSGSGLQNMAGIGAGQGGVLGERTTRDRDRERERERERGAASPSREGREGRRREREWKSMSLSSNGASEQAEMQAEGSPRSGGRERGDRPLPITTASGTDITSPNVVSGRPMSPTVRPTSPLNPHATPTQNNFNAYASPSSIPTPQTYTQVPDIVVADDTSVLPVPSHVVLGHLGTSAIRDGVLAVGATVRYRQKFFTTVYYKPTS